MFSPRFDKQDEDDQVLDETELRIKLNLNQISTQTDIDNIDVRSQSEQQIPNQETKDSGWKLIKLFL